MFERYRMKAKTEAFRIADKLAKMKKEDDIEDYAPKILKLMRGVPYEVWIVLDEQPGLFGYMDDRFYMLRSVRNSPTYGRKMFEGLKRTKI